MIVHHLDGDLAAQNLVVRSMNLPHPSACQFSSKCVPLFKVGLRGDLAEKPLDLLGVVIG